MLSSFKWTMPAFLPPYQCLFTSTVLLLGIKSPYCSDLNVCATLQSSELSFIICNLSPKNTCLHHTSAFNTTQFEDRVSSEYFIRRNTRTTVGNQYRHFCISSVSLNSYSYTNTSINHLSHPKKCWLYKLYTVEVQRKIVHGENGKFNMKLKLWSERITILWEIGHFHTI